MSASILIAILNARVNRRVNNVVKILKENNYPHDIETMKLQAEILIRVLHLSDNEIAQKMLDYKRREAA